MEYLVQKDISLSQVLQWTTALAMTGLVIKLCLLVLKFNRLKETVEKLPGWKRKFFLGNVWDVREMFQSKFPNSAFLFRFLSSFGLLYGDVGMGKLWLVFRPGLVLVRAHTLEPLLSSTTEINKSIEYNFLKEWLGTGLLISDGSKWKSRRKMLTPSFHFRILNDFQPIISEHSQVLVETLKKLPNLFCPNLLSLMSSSSLDIIRETALGVNISAQTNENLSYNKALSIVAGAAMYRVLRPWLWSDFLFGLTQKGHETKKSIRILHNITKKVIQERKEIFIANPDDSKRRLAFLDILLQEHLRNKSFTENDIREEVDTFTFEGHDTTATGLTLCLYMLGLHQDVQEKVYEEMIEIFGNEKDTPVTADHLKNMKYLDCTIKETFRIYPPVPIISRTLKGDLEINKHTVPAGTTCFIVLNELHRDSTYFPNPEIFDPDRFLPENSVGRHPYAYVPFSAGSRNCIGQKFAMNELKTILSVVVRNFKLTSLDLRDKIILCCNLVSGFVEPIKIQLQIRE